MKEKIKTQKGFIQIPLLIAIIASIVVTAGVGYGAFKYHKTSKIIGEADQFAKEEKYEEAIEKLNLAQVSWFVRNLSIKKQEISDKQEENKKLIEELSKYNQGLDEFGKGNWQGAIDLLLEIPDNSFYSNNAKFKIEEAKRKIVEEELGETKIAKKKAEGKAQQEAIKRVQEEVARKEAEQKAQEEAIKRSQAEAKAKQETQARRVAEDKTIEEVTKRATAEQVATNERLAKEQQQQEAAFQQERAVQEEKARILELAKTQPMIKAIVSGELKFYIYPLPSYAATGVLIEVESIATTLSSWSPYDGTKIMRVYSPNDADVTISWIRDYGSEILGQAIFRAYLEVGLGSNNCLGDWRAFTPSTVKKILWHELGHSMGYGHSNNPNNIMYSVMDTRFEVESEISKVVPGGYFTTQPLCSGGGYSYSFKTNDPTTGFNLFVLQPGVDPKNFSEESGLSYSGCGAKRMQSYPGSCVVTSGAKIYIENTSASTAIKLSGKVINTDQSPWPNMTWDQNAFQYDNNQLTKYWELFH